MDIIGIYLDEECSELLTMASVGEYNHIDYSSSGAATTFGTRTIDGESYNFTGLWRCEASTVKNDDPTRFDVPATPSEDYAYIYFTKKLRIISLEK